MFAKLVAFALISVAIADCHKADDAAPPVAPTADAPVAASAAPPAASAATPAKSALVELDLSSWGPPFEGWVATGKPGGVALIEVGTRHLGFSGSEFIAVSETEHFADDAAYLPKITGNSNIKMVGPGEVHYERNPPLGKEWIVHYEIKVGGHSWSCEVATFDSAAKADELLQVCKSIHKK